LRLHALDFAENKGFLQKGQLIPLVGTPASLAFATRKPVLRHRPDFEEFPAPIMKEAYAKGLKSGCAVPLLCHEKIVGSMMLASLRESAFTEDDADLLAQIGAQVAIAVDNVPSTSRAPGAPNRVAAAPYGVVGAVAALWIMGTPSGFMAFLGVASLIGVIVSHVIVRSTSSKRSTKRVNRSKKRSSIPESSAATGNDYGGGNGPGAVSPGPPWGAALATALLHADRGIGGSNVHHFVVGSGAVCNLRHGSQDPEVGDQKRNNRRLESPR